MDAEEMALKRLGSVYRQVVVGRQGFEPWTPGLKVRSSYQLS